MWQESLREPLDFATRPSKYGEITQKLPRRYSPQASPRFDTGAEGFGFDRVPVATRTSINQELKQRTDTLEREISRIRETQAALQEIMIDKHVDLQRSMSRVKTAVSNIPPVLDTLCEVGHKNWYALKRVVDMIEALEVKLSAIEEAVQMHPGSISRIRNSQESLMKMEATQEHDIHNVRSDIRKLQISMDSFALKAGYWEH